MHSRVSDTDVLDCDWLKEALLSRYDLTEEGHHIKLRTAKPLQGESCEQFVVRLQNYMQKWTNMAKSEETWLNVQSLLVKAQFIASCSNDVAVYLKEQAPKDLPALATLADQYFYQLIVRLWLQKKRTDLIQKNVACAIAVIIRLKTVRRRKRKVFM